MIVKYLETNKFKIFILKSLTKKYSSGEKRKLEKEIDKLLGTRELVLGKTFYTIVNLVKLDINEVCLNLFSNATPSNLILFPDSDNKINNFISTYLGDLRLVSEASGIEYNRLTKLFNGEYKNAYPEDVNGLAIAYGLKPSQLFEYFYGEGPRPIIGIIPAMEERAEATNQEGAEENTKEGQ